MKKMIRKKKEEEPKIELEDEIEEYDEYETAVDEDEDEEGTADDGMTSEELYEESQRKQAIIDKRKQGLRKPLKKFVKKTKEPEKRYQGIYQQERIAIYDSENDEAFEVDKSVANLVPILTEILNKVDTVEKAVV